MTDKELIKEEIERLIDIEEETSHLDKLSFNSGRWKALTQMKAFINSLPEEHVSKDLEEYAKKLAKGAALDKHNLIWMCKKGAEWQKQQMKEALQTEYEKGRFDMMEEMMKDAVEGTVKYEIGSAEIPQCDRRYQILSEQVSIPNAKLGNNVKIIILKTEQQ